jgi:hypothetical protein
MALNTVRRGLVAAVVAVAAPLLAVGLASPAYAVEHHPKGEFAIFSDCPLSVPGVEVCVYGTTESGKFVIGKETVPITNPTILQGGLKNFFTHQEVFVGAEDGNTLPPAPQKVPGGLAGLIRCNEISNFLERVACELVFENGVTGVNATTELAGSASSISSDQINLVEGHGTALSLPVKVHLENPFLGSSCYIGSNAHPIVIDLTTGTTNPPPPNTPITGNPGEITYNNEEQEILILKHNSLVNNSFAAPGAEGCGGLFAFLIDPIINNRLALPSAAGKNTAILNGTLRAANVEVVKAHE